MILIMLTFLLKAVASAHSDSSFATSLLQSKNSKTYIYGEVSVWGRQGVSFNVQSPFDSSSFTFERRRNVHAIMGGAVFTRHFGRESRAVVSIPRR